MEKIFKYYRLNSKSFSLLFIITLSFLIFKLPFYDAVTPDYFGLFLSAFILYSYCKKKNLHLLLTLALSFFTNPIVFLIGIILLIFPLKAYQFINLSKVSKLAFLFSCLFGMLILFWATYKLVPMYKAGIELTKWHIPDTIDIRLFPVSALIVSALCAYLSYPLFHHSIHFLHFKNLLKINFFWVSIFIFFIILKSLVVSFNNVPTELDDIDHLLYVWPLYFCMKPLIGVSEHIQSLGILIVFALLTWKRLVSESSKLFGQGGLILLGLFVLFLIKPEARHTLPFIPFLSLLVLRVIPKIFNNSLNILLLFCISIILSKIYYPIQLATFSGNPQYFPAQHYFMFFGFSCNYTMYIYQIIISILTLLFLRKIFLRNELSSL